MMAPPRADLGSGDDLAAGRPSALRRFPLRNLIAKLPKSEHDRIRFNCWSALTDATSVKDAKIRLQAVISL
jgi:hypothetical protein